MSDSNQLISTIVKWTGIFMHRSIHNFILYAKQKDISVPQIGALFLIHHKVVSSVSNLGNKLGITSAGASQMLERLVQMGLITRLEDPNDRRGKQIALTEKGNELLQESIQARQDWVESLVGNLTVQEQEQVVAALNLLIETVKQLETKHPPTQPGEES